MKVLLLSAYAAQSHRYWRQGLLQLFPDWEWRILELPPRYFSWRVRGNPLSWSIAERETLSQSYDLLIATSMVDLATLRGLLPAIGGIPSLYYFHENQFAYPGHLQPQGPLEAQMVSIYGAMAADRLGFNSVYNRETFLDGVSSLLGRLPDHVPDGVVNTLREKSVVLSVPLLAERSVLADWPGQAGELPGRPLRILWSARFEHDKGGEGLLAILQQLEQLDMEYELALTGQQFRSSPAVFAQIETEFRDRLVQFGFVESVAAYHALQRGADVILSTALHEFQGLAVLQAVRAGCLPVVPDRLAYREIFPAAHRYCSSPENSRGEATAAVQLLLRMRDRLIDGTARVPTTDAFSATALEPVYRTLLEELVTAAA